MTPKHDMHDIPRAKHDITRAAHLNGAKDTASNGLTPPLQPATTFERAGDLSYPSGRVYRRGDDPSLEPAANLLAALENAPACCLFSSGMAAAMAVLQALDPGDRVLMPDSLYWGVKRFALTHGVRAGLAFEFLPNRDVTAWETRLSKGDIRLIWLETPSNPDWQIQDIARLTGAARSAGAHSVADNTVATPLLTRPLALGADLVLHSATKYLNGHSDVLAGALLPKQAGDPLWQRIFSLHYGGGAVLGSFDAWLLARGMRTLGLRVARSCENALAIARHFAGHPKMADVLYPGLPTHPDHEIAKRQMQGGFSGMVSLRVKGGADAAVAVQGRCELFRRATSLGGVESLIEHRASVEGDASAVPDDLLRLSVGIENIEDLIADLTQAIG